MRIKKAYFSPTNNLTPLKNLVMLDLAHVNLLNNSLRQTSISEDRYKDFCDEFYKRKCITMGDWLREYNLADIVPFIEALDKTRKQYYPDEIDILKDAVSIPGISMTYVLNKALDLRPPNEPELYAPGEPCTCTCTPDCSKKVCPDCKKKTRHVYSSYKE